MVYDVLVDIFSSSVDFLNAGSYKIVETVVLTLMELSP